MKNINAIIDGLEKSLPPVFARKEVGRLTGGLVAPHTLANAAAKGNGPAGRILIGRHSANNREEFLAWLRARIKPVAKHGTSVHPANVGGLKRKPPKKLTSVWANTHARHISSGWASRMPQRLRN